MVIAKRLSYSIKGLVMVFSLWLMLGCSNLQTTHYGFEAPEHDQTNTRPIIYWQLDDDSLSIEDKQFLVSVVTHELSTIMAMHQGIAIRAKITQVDTVSPLLNGLSSLVLILPFDRGGASIEIQAVDISTGVEVLRESYAQRVGFSDFKAHFSRLEPAKIALRDATAQFSEGITMALKKG